MATYQITLSAKDSASRTIDSLQQKLTKLQLSSGKGLSNIGSGLTTNFKSMSTSVGSFATKLGGIAAVAGGAVAALGLLQGAISSVSRAMDVYTSRQDTETAFETLLGSKSAAKQRSKDLAALGASTPYTYDQLAKMNKTAQATTSGDLATMEWMTRIGDAASATGADIERVTMHITRMYAAMSSGRSFGGALTELSEMGVIDQSAYEQLNSISTGELKIDVTQAEQILAGVLQRHEGGMERMSKTWSGKMSTMADAWDEMLYRGIAPIMDNLAPVLDMVIAGFSNMAGYAEGVGEAISNWIYTFQQFFAGGDAIGKLGDLMLGVLKGFGAGLWEIISKLPELIIEPMMNAFGISAKLLFDVLTDGDLWIAVLKAGTGVMLKIGQVLSTSIIAVIAKIMDGIDWIAEKMGFSATQWGDSMRSWSDDYFDYDAMKDLGVADSLETIMDNSSKHFGEYFEASMENSAKMWSAIGATMADNMSKAIDSTGFKFQTRPVEDIQEANTERTNTSSKKSILPQKETAKIVKETTNTMSDALKEVMDSLSKSGGIEANIGNGYGNLLSPLEVAQNVQSDIASQQLDTQKQQLTATLSISQVLSTIASKITTNSTSNIAVYG